MPASSPALALTCMSVALTLGLGCRSTPDEEARRLEPDEVPARAVAEKPPVWKREPAPMPEAFTRFPLADPTRFAGHWVVDSEIPGQRELWIVDPDGRKSTVIDARGRERVHGLVVLSPCTLALTDDQGRTRSRRFAFVGERLHTSSAGAGAVAAPDGSLLACTGTQTIVVPPSGACTNFSEMLGVWSELGPPTTPCIRPGEGVGEPVELVVGGGVLHPFEGAWMDDVLEAAQAERVADRASGEAALAKPATPDAQPSGVG